MMEIILRNLNFLAQIAESFVLITVIDSFSCQAELNDVNSAGVWFEHSFGDVRNRTHCNLHRVKAALEIDWNVWNLGPKYVMKTSIDRIFHAESNDVYINRIGTENILGKAKNRTHWHLHTWSSTTPQNVSSRIWKKNLCLYAAIGAIFPSETNGMLFGKNEIPKHVGFDEEWKPLRSFVWSNSGRLIGQRRHHVICDTWFEFFVVSKSDTVDS